MKKKFVRLISAVLSAVMTLTAVPLSAFAEGEGHTHDGESNVITTPLDFREKTADENGVGWSWDHDTKKLTLDGINIQAEAADWGSAVISVPDGTEIVLNGENTIVQTNTDSETGNYALLSGTVDSNGILSEGKLTISGNGTLNVTNRSRDKFSSTAVTADKLTINGSTVNAENTVNTSTLEIHGGTLNAEATDYSPSGAALSVCAVTIDGEGKLTAVGKADENVDANAAIKFVSAAGIGTGCKLTVSDNGSITVPANNGAKYGIYSDKSRINAEISGKVTAYGTLCGISSINLTMSGSGSVYATGGTLGINNIDPLIDEDEFVIKGSTEFKADESAVTGDAQYVNSWYCIGEENARTVVIKPDTEPSIKLGKQIGAVYADDVGNNSSAYFYITAKNFADGAFVPEAEWVTSPGSANIDANITKTGGEYVCEVICDEPDLSRQYELRVKSGEVYSNTVTVTVGKPHFALTSRDSQSKYYTNYNGEQKITLRYDVEAGYENQDGLQYNWSSDSKKYDIADLGTVTTVDGVETLVFSDNVPEGSYVIYCDVVYNNDNGEAYTLTERFAFTFEECKHTGGFTDEVCNICHNACDHKNIDTDTGICVCGRQFVATISTDGSAPTGYDTLADCLNSITADSGNYVKIYQDIEKDSSQKYIVKYHVTLDLNGHRLDDKLEINEKNSEDNNGELTLTGTGYIDNVYAYSNTTFTIDDNANIEADTFFNNAGTRFTVSDGANVTVRYLAVKESISSEGNATSVKLATGMKITEMLAYDRDISSPLSENIMLKNLLSDNQMLKYESSSKIIDLYYGASRIIIDSKTYGYGTITVVEHTDACHKYSSETGKCKECGKPCEHGGDINTDNGVCATCGAVVSVALYTDTNGISKYVDTDELHSLLNEYGKSGTVKLFKDYYKIERHDIDGVITIDLNGHNFTVRGVTPWSGGKVTFKNSGSEQVTCSGSVSPTVDAPGGTLIVDGDIYFDSAININDYGTVILNAGKYVDLTIKGDRTLCDMLGEGKAFYNSDGTVFNAKVQAGSDLTVKDHSHTYVDGKCGCGYVCPHSNIDINTGKCTECEYQYAAVIVKDGAVAYVYKDTEMEAAFEAADSDTNTGCTLRVYKNYTGSYTTLSGKFTLWIAKEANVGTLTVSGDITVTGSEKNNSIFGDFNVAAGGKLTFDENCGAMGTVSVGAGTFDCYYSIGTTLNINDASSDVILHGGYFIKIRYNGGGDRANAEILTLLAENRMFMTRSNDPIDGSKTLLKDGFATTVLVIPHEGHGYDSTTGKCTICGKRCGHTDINTETGMCKTCQYEFVATLTVGDKVTGFDSLSDCLSKTSEDSENYVKIYKNIDDRTTINVNHTVTVDLNGHKLYYIELEVNNDNGAGNLTLTGSEGSYISQVDVCGGRTFKIDSDANINFNAIFVEAGARFEVSYGANVTVNTLVVKESLTLYGSTTTSVRLTTGMRIGTLTYDLDRNSGSGNLLLYSLLGEGKALQYDNSGEYVDIYEKFTSKIIRDSFTVVYHYEHSYDKATGKCVCGYVCPHSDVDSKTGVCSICEYQLTAGVSGVGTAKYFGNIDDAFAAATSEENNGCTLTLYKDCELSQNIVIGNATVTVDMNGHSILLAYRIKVNDGGVLYLKNSGENGSIETEIDVNKGGTLINGTADDSRSAVSVFGVTADAAKRVEIYGGSYEGLTVNNGTSGIALYGGSYESINTNDLTDSTPVSALLAKGYAFATLNSVTHLPESIVDGSETNLNPGLENVMVVAHTHTYTETNPKCACGAVLYAKVTSADGTSNKYFDSIEEGLLYADKAENKGCVFTLVARGLLKDKVTLSSGQFTIATATTDNTYVIGPYEGEITIDGADVIAEGDLAFRCNVCVESGSLTLPEGSGTGFDSIIISGGTVTISEGVNADSYAGADNLSVDKDATDVKLTIGGGTYGKVYFGQLKFKDVLASGVRVISYDNPSDPTAEKTATALLYSDIAEESSLNSNNGTVSYYLVTKCEHKNEDGSYAFNEGGICKYCNSEFAASVSYTDGGSEKTELVGDICDAFDKANEAGTATITLYKDIADSEIAHEINVTGNVTLALNGKTLGATDKANKINICGSTLTVNGNGKVWSAIEARTDSKLTITNGEYYDVYALSDSEVVILDGIIDCLSVYGTGKAEVSGGKFKYLFMYNGKAIESVLADGYAYKNADGTWLSIDEREKDSYLGGSKGALSVEEAPIKSASIAWVGEEAPVIYRNGEKYLYVNITYELAVGSRGATYSDFVNGNNRIKDYNLYNKYMVHCYEIGKLAAKDGEVEYYTVLKCNGYEYKSNVLKLTLATCSHPEDSFSYENDGLVICGICDALIEAEVVDADGKSLGYADIESAIKLAQENEGSTVKLMSEGVSESITVTGGRFTIDFNGKMVFYQFAVSGGDVTFTSSVKQADAETLISGITVNGTDAKVTIDGKIKLGSVTLTSGTLTVNSTQVYIKELSINGGKAVIDDAIIGALKANGGDTVINCVEADSLSVNINGSSSISIVTGTFGSTTCERDSGYTLGMAIASGSVVSADSMNGITVYTYEAIQTMTSTYRIFVDKCNHKDKNGSYVLDGNPCPYCNEEIVATVSYTANGSEETELFSDIYDAFAKANEAGTATVTLYKDITDDITDTIAVTGNVTVELNGKKLLPSGFDPFYTIEVKSGKLTVNGSGSINRVVVRNGGDAEINGGIFSDFRIEDGGNAVINGGKFNSIKVSGEGRNVGQLLADGYAYKNFNGFWSTVAEREKQGIASVNVLEAPIKSATITANDESLIIYRNGNNSVDYTANVTYTGNETLYVTRCLIDGTVIREKTIFNGHCELRSGEVNKAVAEDGEIQYYCIFTYDGYDYKSNVVTLTVATCRHPVESVKCDDNGYVCGICDRALTASVELSDGTLSYYGKWNDAIGAAEESEGCTLKLLNYSGLKDNETFDISKGRFTVDLNKNDSSGPFAFNVKGGDITFTALKKASISFTGVTVSGENANVLIDSKATLNYLVVNSGKVSVDGAFISAITINGGDTVINDVDAGLLSEEGNGSVNISIVSGRFESVVFDEYTFGKAIASGSRIRLTDADGGKIYKYADIQNKGNAGVIVVEKCDHKDENDSYKLDGKPCPYCNEEIVATVSYTTADGENTDLFSDIYDAFEKANEVGTATITLYKDIENSEFTRYITVTGNVTLALNGKKLGYSFVSRTVEVSDGGMLTVDGDGKMMVPIIVNENAKLTVNGGEIATVMIYKDGDAVIGGGFIEDLDVNGNVKLSGGKFYNIEIANGSLESVLADGYAYKVDGGAWLSIAERAKEKYYSWNNEDKPVNVEEAPIKSATLSTKINKLYRNSNANPTVKFNPALAHGSLNDSDASMRYGINSYESGDTVYNSLSTLVTNTKLSADEIIDKAGNSNVAEIYYIVTFDGYEVKTNTVCIDLVDCDHSQVVDPTADKETAGNITEPTYCEICESKFNAKITKGDDVRYYNDLDEAVKDAQKSENEGCTLYPLYNKNGYGGQLVITEGNFTLKYAVRTAFSNPVVIKGNAKLKVTGRCAVTSSENPDAFTVNDGDVTFDGLATGSNVTINGGNVTMSANNINCLTINGGNVSISSGGFAEIVTTVSDKVIADYIDHGFWVQDRGTKEWIDIYSLSEATASSTNVLSVRLCPMQIIKPIDTVYYTNGYYPDGIPSLQINAEPWYSNEVNAKVAYQWIAIDENGNETEIEGATDRKLSLENLTTGRYYCRLTYSNAATAGVSMKSDVVTATITECEHSGGKATCTERAKCEICGAEYGETKPHSYAHIKAPEYLKSAATCTAKAVYYTSCTECGQSSKGTADEETFEYGNALGHKYGAWVSNGDGTHTRVCANDNKHTETKDCHGGKATCTAKAICEDCGKAYGKMTAHTFTKTVSEKYLKSAATCTAKAVYYTSCADCGLSSKGTADEETFEYGNALGHKYGKWVSNGDGTHTRVCANDSTHTETKDCHGGKATCTAKAICEDCGKAYGEMTAHTFTKTVSEKYLKSAATCTAKAVYYTSCADCGLSSKGTADEETFEYGNALGHKYGKWVSNGDGTHTRVCANDNKHTETKACHGGKATCTAKAICEDCGKAYGEMTAHTFTAKSTISRYLKRAATCTEKSEYYVSCAGCGLSSKGTASEAVFTGSALGHSLTEWSVITEVTCTTNGTQERHCIRCDYKQTRTIVAKGHSYGLWNVTKKVGCITDGEQSRECSVCGNKETKTIAATGVHSYGSWKVAKAATCTTTGTKVRSCSECGVKETVILQPTGHKYVESTVKPTYTEKGYTLHKCSECGTSYKSSYTDKLVLASVSGVKLAGRAADALRVSWNRNTSADGYIVEIYKDGAWARAGKITTDSTTDFKVTGLKASTFYKFRVKAYKMSGNTAVYSDYGTTLTARTNPSVIKGAKLAGRAADALRISWDRNTSADGYIVEIYKDGAWSRAVKTTNNSITTYKAEGLKASTVYKLRVRAYKMDGTAAYYGNYSAEVTARTNPSVIKGAKLAGRAADALRISWERNTSADGYIVEIYKDGAWSRAGKITTDSTTDFRVTGLKASTVYKLRVRAYKMSGTVAYYGNYSAEVTARTNPSVMTGVKIGGTAKDALRINWSKNTSAQGYIVEMAQNGEWVRVAKITDNSTTTFRKAGLAKNTSYRFRVCAYHMSGSTPLYGTYVSVSGKTAAN